MLSPKTSTAAIVHRPWPAYMGFPQFQQNVSVVDTRAPQWTQLWTSIRFGAAGGGGRGGGGGGGGGEGGGGESAGAGGGAFAFIRSTAFGSNTAPHSVHFGCSAVTAALQTGHTYPRKTRPRFPNPRPRPGWGGGSRPESNPRSRRGSNPRA